MARPFLLPRPFTPSLPPAVFTRDGLQNHLFPVTLSPSELNFLRRQMPCDSRVLRRPQPAGSHPQPFPADGPSVPDVPGPSAEQGLRPRTFQRQEVEAPGCDRGREATVPAINRSAPPTRNSTIGSVRQEPAPTFAAPAPHPGVHDVLPTARWKELGPREVKGHSESHTAVERQGGDWNPDGLSPGPRAPRAPWVEVTAGLLPVPCLLTHRVAASSQESRKKVLKLDSSLLLSGSASWFGSWASYFSELRFPCWI